MVPYPLMQKYAEKKTWNAVSKTPDELGEASNTITFGGYRPVLLAKVP